MLRLLASLPLLALLALDLALPQLALGRRGSSPELRADAPAAAVAVGEPMPDFAIPGLDGRTFRLSELRGHPVLLTFERSVDW